MKILDETGAIMENPDLTLGYLPDDPQPLEHPAQEAVAEVAHYETVAEYPGGGKDVQRVVDVPGVPARPAWTEQLPIKRYIRYTAEELVGMRSELASAIEADLSAKLIKYNIELVSTSVENMDFTDVFTEAVEAKQVAAQNKLTAQTRAEQEVIEAEAAARVQVIQAQADADAMLAKAQAEAEATRIRAEAEAEANAKVAASLTEALIKYTYAQAWDGKYPTYYGGSSSTMPVIDLR